ncbi:hypothetical protein F5Y18DRAFT_425787 [Xylariaceae sp. FL1019]|nr:hypothetical protein F5Y18DRAFT_425787 [Xylariaceae sp. FL1019]
MPKQSRVPQRWLEEVNFAVEVFGSGGAQTCAVDWINDAEPATKYAFVVPFAGSTSWTRLTENATHIELTDADLKAIDDILASVEVPDIGLSLPRKWDEATAKAILNSMLLRTSVRVYHLLL